MKKVKMAFVLEVNIPVLEGAPRTGTEAPQNHFSLEQFELELKDRLEKQQLFFGLPVKITKEIIQKENSEWIIYGIQTEGISKQVFLDQKKTKDSELWNFSLSGETNYLAFRVEKEEGGKYIREFGTNLRAGTAYSGAFRRMMYAIPSFTNSFFKVLLPTEYFIYDASLAKEVWEKYLQVKEGNKEVSNDNCYFHAICQVPYAMSSSLYYVDNTWLERSRKFEALAFINYNNRTPLNIFNMLNKSPDEFKLPMCFEDFVHSVGAQSMRYVAEHIGEQLSDVMSEYLTGSYCSLDVGSGYGNNNVAIQQKYSNVVCFGVEPMAGCVAGYLGNVNRLFHSDLENLIDKYLELEGSFDIVFILNYNVLSDQTLFWESVRKCLKNDGKVIVGRVFFDPNFIGSPTPLIQYMKNSFEEVNFVKPTFKRLFLKDTIGFDSDAMGAVAAMKDEFIEFMPELNGDPDLEKAIKYYSENYRQFLFCAKKPRETTIGLTKQYKTEFGQHVSDISQKEYQQCIIRRSDDDFHNSFNDRAIEEFRRYLTLKDKMKELDKAFTEINLKKAENNSELPVTQAASPSIMIERGTVGATSTTTVTSTVGKGLELAKQ